MNKHKVFRLKPGLKQFLQAISLTKYIIFFVGFNYFLIGVLLGDFGGEAAMISVLLDGFYLILGTLLDVIVTIAKWFATHRIIFKVEEKNIKIV